jgi:leucyl aminopeptidase (aminopeptidase T)
MFEGREYFREWNERDADAYEEAIAGAREIHERTRDAADPWPAFFHRTSGLFLELAGLEERLDDASFTGRPLEEIAAENAALFDEVRPENYPASDADPAFAVKTLGDGVGQIASFVTMAIRGLVRSAFRHRRFEFARRGRLLMEVFETAKDGDPDRDALLAAATSLERGDKTEDFVLANLERDDPAFRFARDIAETAVQGDLRALYRYGLPVSEHDVRAATFLATWPQEKIDRLASTMLAAYLRGFEVEGKDITKKSSVAVVGPIGYERLFARLLPMLEEAGLAPIYSARPSAPLNRQLDYDHRFDYALYLDAESADRRVASYESALKKCAAIVRANSGIILLEAFGETPFTPEIKEACLRADEETAEVFQRFRSRATALHYAHAPREETSFSIVAFPSPEIRGDFEGIFADTLEINMLENDRYERIQDAIIRVLDTAEHVHVKGRGDNRTDLRVAMPPIADPATQTNYVNCVADVNIPVGEVFTSPRLAGTNGILHVEEAFLKGLRFLDLEITYEDGYIAGYSCANFDDPEKNRTYVHENLIHPHETLPIGEFAIGTNTLAYALAKRHGIMDLLPVLIIEKMGPHLAVGDTCFSFQEDHAVKNPLDGKEVVARENERSALRTEDPQKAYLNTHTDITLPYSSLDTITAVTADGERTDVIRRGRFVLPGTEELNAAIEEVDG